MVSRRDAFLSNCPAALRSRLDARPDLDVRLDEIVGAARAAWPAFETADEPFLAFVAQRLPEGQSDPLAQIRASDLFLAHACATGSAAALDAFEDAWFDQVGVLCRRVSPAVDVDEVKQELRCRLFMPDGQRPPRISAYSGAGELRNWFRVAVTRLALNRLRATKARYDEAGDVLLDELAPTIDGPELEPYKARYASAFKTAFEQAMADLDVRERLLLRYQVVDGLRVEDIARVFDVHRSSVARWLATAKRNLLSHTRRHLGHTLGLSDEELQSVIGLVLSRIEVTLSRLLP